MCWRRAAKPRGRASRRARRGEEQREARRRGGEEASEPLSQQEKERAWSASTLATRQLLLLLLLLRLKATHASKVLRWHEPGAPSQQAPTARGSGLPRREAALECLNLLCLAVTVSERVCSFGSTHITRRLPPTLPYPALVHLIPPIFIPPSWNLFGITLASHNRLGSTTFPCQALLRTYACGAQPHIHFQRTTFNRPS